jgi:hypothetical protein
MQYVLVDAFPGAIETSIFFLLPSMMLESNSFVVNNDHGAELKLALNT